MHIYRSNIIKACRTLFILVLANQAQVAVADAIGPNWMLESELAVHAESSQFFAPTLDLKGTYNFEPVEYTSGPYAEHDFLNPTTTLSIRALTEASQGRVENFNGHHLSMNSSIVRSDHIYQPKVHFTNFADNKTYGLGMQYAYLITDASRISAGINLNREQIATGEVLVSKANIAYKKLWQYDKSRAFAAEFDFEYTDTENESRTYSISKLSTDLDYYINRRWSLGFNLNHSSSEIKRFQSYGLGASTKYFFNPDLGVEFGVGIKYREETSLGVNAGLNLIKRF